MAEKLENKLNTEKRKAIVFIEGDAEKYYDKYVAMASFNDRRVIAYGENPSKVVEEARKKGIGSPVIFYVPNPKTIQIYPAVA